NPAAAVAPAPQLLIDGAQTVAVLLALPVLEQDHLAGALAAAFGVVRLDDLPASVQAGWADLPAGVDLQVGRGAATGPRPDLHTIEEHPGGFDHALARRLCDVHRHVVLCEEAPAARRKMRDAVHGVGVVRGEQHLPGLPRDVHRVV